MRFGALCLVALVLSVLGCGDPPPAPALTFAESSIMFSDAVIEHAIEQTIILTNTGNVSVSASFALSDDEAFSVTHSTCDQVAPGDTCSVVVKFEPHTLGAHTTDLIATGGGISVATSVVGMALPEPGLSSTSPVQFGDVRVTVPKTQRVSVLNGSSVTGRAYAVNLGGANVDDFTISNDGCSGIAPRPQASCTIDITFTPSARFSRSAELVVTSANLGSLMIELTGNGTGPAQLSVSPPSGMFGSIFEFADSPPHSFTVTNIGDEPSETLQVMIIGPSSNYFWMTDGCSGSPLAAGASCMYSIVYQARTVGQHQAVAEVSAFSLASVVVPLTGTGVPALISITPPDWDYGQIVAGQTSAPKTFTIENTGTTNTGPLAISFQALQTAPFAVSSDACTGVDLTPSATCTIAVTAAPLRGPHSAKLLVGGTRGDKGSSLLSVEGLGPATLGSAPSAVAFGDIQMTDKPSRFVIIDNRGDLDTGTIAVAITGPDSADVNLVDDCTGRSLQESDNCSMTVSFAPSHLGSATAAIEITSPGASLTIPVTANTLP